MASQPAKWYQDSKTLRMVSGIAVLLCAVLAGSAYYVLVWNAEDLSLKWTRGLNPDNMDPTVKPHVDFNVYANGNWLKSTAIPDEYSKWGTFFQQRDDTLASLNAIMEQAARVPYDPEAVSDVMKVGAFWQSAMDVGYIDAVGLMPLYETRKAIYNISDIKSYCTLLGQLHAAGFDQLFGIEPAEDPRNSENIILWADQGGLGMPDREYYLDPQHGVVREKYHTYIYTLLLLSGYTEESAAAAAQEILLLETRLAQASDTQEYRRDPSNINHPTTVKGLKSMTGSAFNWEAYFAALGLAPGKKTINAPNPAFFKEIGALLKEFVESDQEATILEVLKAYHDFHTISTMAPSLAGPFVDAKFEYVQALTGQKKLSQRWKRMIAIADGTIGELVGKLYCEVMFPAQSKQHALDIVLVVRDELRGMLSTLEWMSPRTRTRALEKVDKMRIKIGYPDKWIDYSTLTIDPRAALATNVLAGMRFNTKRRLDQLWKPVDKTLWHMTPQTVNAYYNPAGNEIVFPAAILQPPMFSPGFDAAVNFGAMGAVVGHELTHGFDDMGRKYDADGNLKDWWTPRDAQKFTQRAESIVKQFSSYKVYGKHLNGNLTQGENIADLGGLKIAYRAMHRALPENYTMQGFTQDQRFFLSWAQVWRQLAREAAVMQQLATDPHSPAEWRIKGPLSNMPEFYEAFSIPSGSPMWRAPQDRVSVW